MRRAAGAIGAVIAAAVVIEGLKAIASRDSHHHPSLEAYCLSCRAIRQIKEPRTVQMKNQRTGAKGSCPVCGKGLFSTKLQAA